MKWRVLFLSILFVAAACQSIQVSNNQLERHNRDAVRGIPSDVLQEQITYTYSINGYLYVLAIEPNAIMMFQRSTPFPCTGTASCAATDPQLQGYRISYNAVGVFSENQIVYIDIVNEIGKSQLIRLETIDDGVTMRRIGCYYFIPENYYRDIVTGQIQPDRVQRTGGCPY